jgi:hypothetical protein
MPLHAQDSAIGVTQPEIERIGEGTRRLLDRGGEERPDNILVIRMNPALQGDPAGENVMDRGKPL